MYLRRRYWIRRSGFAFVALAIVVGLVFALNGTPSGSENARPTRGTQRSGAHPKGSAGSAPTQHNSPTTTSTQPAPPAPIRGIPETMTESTFVDSSRSVTSHGTVLASSRTLPTYVWSPTSGGPFPWVVFVHGYNIAPLSYQRFCSTLASAGYVVAAPSLPLEDPARGFGLDRNDIPNEATDVSFAITSLLDQSVARRIDPTRVAVVGHSDGADVVLLVGYGAGHVDPRIRSVVADAPDPMTGAIQPSTVSLLLVQGTADSVVPYSSSQEVFGQVQAPVYYVSLVGADHLPPIAGGTSWTPVLDESVAAFLDATLAGRGGGVESLASTLSASPLVR